MGPVFRFSSLTGSDNGSLPVPLSSVDNPISTYFNEKKYLEGFECIESIDQPFFNSDYQFLEANENQPIAIIPSFIIESRDSNETLDNNGEINMDNKVTKLELDKGYPIFKQWENALQILKENFLEAEFVLRPQSYSEFCAHLRKKIHSQIEYLTKEEDKIKEFSEKRHLFEISEKEVIQAYLDTLEEKVKKLTEATLLESINNFIAQLMLFTTALNNSGLADPSSQILFTHKCNQALLNSIETLEKEILISNKIKEEQNYLPQKKMSRIIKIKNYLRALTQWDGVSLELMKDDIVKNFNLTYENIKKFLISRHSFWIWWDYIVCIFPWKRKILIETAAQLLSVREFKKEVIIITERKHYDSSDYMEPQVIKGLMQRFGLLFFEEPGTMTKQKAQFKNLIMNFYSEYSQKIGYLKEEYIFKPQKNKEAELVALEAELVQKIALSLGEASQALVEIAQKGTNPPEEKTFRDKIKEGNEKLTLMSKSFLEGFESSLAKCEGTLYPLARKLKGKIKEGNVTQLFSKAIMNTNFVWAKESRSVKPDKDNIFSC